MAIRRSAVRNITNSNFSSPTPATELTAGLHVLLQYRLLRAFYCVQARGNRLCCSSPFLSGCSPSTRRLLSGHSPALFRALAGFSPTTAARHPIKQFALFLVVFSQSDRSSMSSATGQLHWGFAPFCHNKTREIVEPPDKSSDHLTAQKPPSTMSTLQ